MSENQRIINVVVNEGPKPSKISPFFFIGIAMFLLFLAGSCHLLMWIVEVLR